MVNDMNERSDILRCPTCGAVVRSIPTAATEFRCNSCGGIIRLQAQVQNEPTYISEDFRHLTVEQVIRRAGQLFYAGKYVHAAALLEKMLVYAPDDARLLEMENQCECFRTQNFGNYLKMLAVRTFLTPDECARYVIEINGFCNMVGNNATHSVNTPVLRRQNEENYGAILNYIVDLKRCLRNEAIMHDGVLYEAVRRAVLKLSAIVCNTVYVRSSRVPTEYVMLIDLNYRRALKYDFDLIDPHGESEYKIVDESMIKQYVMGG